MRPVRSFSFENVRAVLAVTPVVVNCSTWAKDTCEVENPENKYISQNWMRNLTWRRFAKKTRLRTIF
jgi:hypothetical protein